MRSQESLDALVEGVVREVVAKIAKPIAASIASKAEAELKKSLSSGKPIPKAARRSRPREEMTKWTADKRARRVPKFVIKATGLDTKKKIVAKFGANATFEQGKPLPKILKAA